MSSHWFQWVAEDVSSCRKAAELASLSLDRHLSFRQRFGLWMHQRICAACKQYAAQLQFLRLALRAYARRAEDASAILSAEARQRIQQALL